MPMVWSAVTADAQPLLGALTAVDSQAQGLGAGCSPSHYLWFLPGPGPVMGTWHPLQYQVQTWGGVLHPLQACPPQVFSVA